MKHVVAAEKPQKKAAAHSAFAAQIEAKYPNGVWRTVHGHKVYIHDGKVVPETKTDWSKVEAKPKTSKKKATGKPVAKAAVKAEPKPKTAKKATEKPVKAEPKPKATKKVTAKKATEKAVPSTRKKVRMPKLSPFRDRADVERSLVSWQDRLNQRLNSNKNDPTISGIRARVAVYQSALDDPNHPLYFVGVPYVDALVRLNEARNRYAASGQLDDNAQKARDKALGDVVDTEHLLKHLDRVNDILTGKRRTAASIVEEMDDDIVKLKGLADLKSELLFQMRQDDGMSMWPEDTREFDSVMAHLEDVLNVEDKVKMVKVWPRAEQALIAARQAMFGAVAQDVGLRFTPAAKYDKKFGNSDFGRVALGAYVAVKHLIRQVEEHGREPEDKTEALEWLGDACSKDKAVHDEFAQFVGDDSDDKLLRSRAFYQAWLTYAYGMRGVFSVGPRPIVEGGTFDPYAENATATHTDDWTPNASTLNEIARGLEVLPKWMTLGGRNHICIHSGQGHFDRRYGGLAHQHSGSDEGMDVHLSFASKDVFRHEQAHHLQHNWLSKEYGMFCKVLSGYSLEGTGLNVTAHQALQWAEGDAKGWERRNNNFAEEWAFSCTLDYPNKGAIQVAEMLRDPANTPNTTVLNTFSAALGDRPPKWRAPKDGKDAVKQWDSHLAKVNYGTSPVPSDDEVIRMGRYRFGQDTVAKWTPEKVQAYIADEQSQYKRRTEQSAVSYRQKLERHLPPVLVRGSLDAAEADD